MLGAVARHHGVLGGKLGRGNGNSVPPPLAMLVIAEVNWCMELRYLVEGWSVNGCLDYTYTHWVVERTKK